MAHVPTRRTVIAGAGVAAILLGAQTVAVMAGAAPAPAPLALVTIPDPREASLLRLHGYSGAGTALLRLDGECYSLPVRFVAGDFGGRAVMIDRGGPIRLRITGADAVRALYEGRDLVSDQLRDVVIEAGLSAETGFVINPGSSVLADLFGARPTPVPCTALEEGQPGAGQRSAAAAR